MKIIDEREMQKKAKKQTITEKNKGDRSYNEGLVLHQ